MKPRNLMHQLLFDTNQMINGENWMSFDYANIARVIHTEAVNAGYTRDYGSEGHHTVIKFVPDENDPEDEILVRHDFWF